MDMISERIKTILKTLPPNVRSRAQQWRNRAVEQNVQRNVEKCEEYMEEALRMIRKTDGEYPTE